MIRMIADNQKFITKEQASFTELIEHQESIILDLQSLHYFSLNAAATLIWKHLRSGSATSVEELSQELAAVFEVSPNTAIEDTREFIDELVAHQLIFPCGQEVRGFSSFAMPSIGEAGIYDTPYLRTSSNVMQEMNLASGSSSGGGTALGG